MMHFSKSAEMKAGTVIWHQLLDGTVWWSVMRCARDGQITMMVKGHGGRWVSLRCFLGEGLLPRVVNWDTLSGPDMNGKLIFALKVSKAVSPEACFRIKENSWRYSLPRESLQYLDDIPIRQIHLLNS